MHFVHTHNTLVMVYIYIYLFIYIYIVTPPPSSTAHLPLGAAVPCKCDSKHCQMTLQTGKSHCGAEIRMVYNGYIMGIPVVSHKAVAEV